jgi:hypothetical protein
MSKQIVFTIILLLSGNVMAADFQGTYEFQTLSKESSDVIPSVNPSIDERKELAQKVSHLTKDVTPSDDNSRVVEFLEVEVGSDIDTGNVVDNSK